MTWKDLVAESELSFGFINGVGIGSFLLALVAIVFIIRRGWLVYLNPQGLHIVGLGA